MGVKEDFITALNDMPESVSSFESVTIPELEDISTPETVDDAIIASGVLCKNMNDVLQCFEGFSPVALGLRIGQLCPTPKAMLLSMLQSVGEQSDFTIINHENSGVYNEGETTFGVNITTPENVVTEAVCLVVGSGTSEAIVLDNEGSGTVYTGDLDVSEGEYSIVYMVSFFVGGFCRKTIQISFEEVA